MAPVLVVHTMEGEAVAEAPEMTRGAAGPQFEVPPAILPSLAEVSGAVAVDLARREISEVASYVQEQHFSVKVLCFCVGIGLFVCSALGLLSVFFLVLSPIQYLLSAYNLLFALVIMTMGGKPQWFEGRRLNAQLRLLSAAPVLASRSGLAAFYFYVGSLNLFMLPEVLFWRVAYLSVGVALCTAGIVVLVHDFRLSSMKAAVSPVGPEA